MNSYQQLFAELKRRHVFRVMAVYGAVAFGLIQLADPLAKALLLPDVFLTYVVVVLILGLPLALVLAWAFEVTPDGVRKAVAATPAEIDAIVTQPPSRRWPSGLLALAGIGLLVASAWWVGGHGGDATTQAADGASDLDGARLALGAPAEDARPSIAVLPFVNMSDDESQEYFSDGMTEEILNVLAKLSGLRVTARTSAFAFKGESIDLRAVGDSLGVRYLIEGSVRKAGSQLRITAQLIDASDGSHVWSESYDRQLANVFEIQREIAEAVAGALTIPLGLEGDETLVAVTGDVEAYDLYLVGRARMRERGSGLVEARNLFEAAIAHDSVWAPAWAALAEVTELLVWGMMTRQPGTSPEEYVSRTLAEAERAARRALDLDPRSASALVALGSVHRDRAEWTEAEAAYLRALELDRDNPEAHQQYGEYLLDVGRISEGVRAIDRATVLDPADVRLGTLARALLFDDRRSEAIEVRELMAARERSPGQRALYLKSLASFYLVGGHGEEAVDAYLRAKQADPDRIPESVAEIEEFVAAIHGGNPARIPADVSLGMHPFHWVMVGERDRAIRGLLEVWGVVPRNADLWDPVYEPLLSDPRIEELLARRGLVGVEPHRTPVDERSELMTLQRLKTP
jgi:TolB-like protein